MSPFLINILCVASMVGGLLSVMSALSTASHIIRDFKFLASIGFFGGASFMYLTNAI